MTESKSRIVCIPSSKKDHKTLDSPDSLSDEQILLRRSKSLATAVVPRLKGYSAEKTLDFLRMASKLEKQEGRREAHYQLIFSKYKVSPGDETIKSYIRAVEQTPGGVLIELSQAEERKHKRQLKEKGTYYLVWENIEPEL